MALGEGSEEGQVVDSAGKVCAVFDEVVDHVACGDGVGHHRQILDIRNAQRLLNECWDVVLCGLIWIGIMPVLIVVQRIQRHMPLAILVASCITKPYVIP